MERKYLDLAGLIRYNNKLKSGQIKVGHSKNTDSIPSSGIRWGTDKIPLANIPSGALERIHIVANDTERFKLTSTQVLNGDTVKVTEGNKMYFVKDDTKLNNSTGYEPYSAGLATSALEADSVDWSGIKNKPSEFDVKAHGSDKVTSLTGYSKNSSIGGDLSASDNLNTALSKLERNIENTYAVPFQGMVSNVNVTTQSLLGTAYVFFDSVKKIFVASSQIFGGSYYNNFGGSIKYGTISPNGIVPKVGQIYYQDNGSAYIWDGNSLIQIGDKATIESLKTSVNRIDQEINGLVRISEAEINAIV